jgi:site-specific DNA recombinase
MADLYRAKVTSLCAALEQGDPFRAEAHEAIRGLIDAIALEPDGDQLRITLKGNLAGMLTVAGDKKRPPETDDLLDQIQLVAGARNHHYLQLWRLVA